MGKKSKNERSKGKGQTKAGLPARFVPGPAADSFQGRGFSFGNAAFATYEDARLQQSVYPSIDAVLCRHGYSNVATAELLAHAVGYQSDKFIVLTGPPFSASDCFAFVEGEPGGPLFSPNMLLAKDRAMVDDLMKAVFSQPDSVARNSSAVALDAASGTCEYRFSTGLRKFVTIYSAVGSPVGDFMRVTIQGQGNSPNQFKFEPSFPWLRNRYGKPGSTGLDQSAAGID